MLTLLVVAALSSTRFCLVRGRDVRLHEGLIHRNSPLSLSEGDFAFVDGSGDSPSHAAHSLRSLLVRGRSSSRSSGRSSRSGRSRSGGWTRADRERYKRNNARAEARKQRQRRRNAPKNPSWMSGAPIQKVVLPPSEDPLPGPICRQENFTKCKPHSNPYLNGNLQMIDRKTLYAMAYESQPTNVYKKPTSGPVVECSTKEDCKHLGKLCVDGKSTSLSLSLFLSLSLSLSLFSVFILSLVVSSVTNVCLLNPTPTQESANVL